MPEQQVSILFADVKGFSGLRDAEVNAFVTRVLPGIATRLAHLESGPLVCNTWGDGIFLVFHLARDAAQCAVDLRDLVRDTHWPAAGIHGGLKSRIALHNAHVLVTDDPITKKTNAYGPHINMAARLEPVTEPNEVFATEAFKGALDLHELPAYTWDEIGPTPLAKSWGTSNVYRLRKKTEQPFLAEKLTENLPEYDLKKELLNLFISDDLKLEIFCYSAESIWNAVTPIFEQIHTRKSVHMLNLKLLVRDCKSSFIIPCDENFKRDTAYNIQIKNRGERYIREFRAAAHDLTDHVGLEVKTHRFEPLHKGIIVNRNKIYWTMYPITLSRRGYGGKNMWDYYGPSARYVELRRDGGPIEAATFASIVGWFDVIWQNSLHRHHS